MDRLIMQREDQKITDRAIRALEGKKEPFRGGWIAITTQREIAEECNISVSVVNRAIQQLIENGEVQKLLDHGPYYFPARRETNIN